MDQTPTSSRQQAQDNSTAMASVDSGVASVPGDDDQVLLCVTNRRLSILKPAASDGAYIVKEAYNLSSIIYWKLNLTKIAELNITVAKDDDQSHCKFLPHIVIFTYGLLTELCANVIAMSG